MDIAALSIQMKSINLSNQVGLAVAKMSMDTAKENSDQMVKMMEQSVTPNLGGNLDISV